MEYHQCNESVKQKIFGRACLGKKRFFIRNFANFAKCEILRFFKKIFFIWSRSCPNQTKRGMEYHLCNESVKQKNFWLSAPRKKLGFHTEFCEFRELRIFENFNFFFSGSRSCPNQTKRGMEYHQCNESVKQKKKFGWARLGKSWVFIRNFANFANCEFLRILIFFRRVKELSKSNQTRYGVSPV